MKQGRIGTQGNVLDNRKADMLFILLFVSILDCFLNYILFLIFVSSCFKSQEFLLFKEEMRRHLKEEEENNERNPNYKPMERAVPGIHQAFDIQKSMITDMSNAAVDEMRDLRTQITQNMEESNKTGKSFLCFFCFLTDVYF